MAEYVQPHPTIFETIELAARLHRDQFDKNGVPYITHPLSVMRMAPKAAWHVAVLHDTLEDCGVTTGRLEAFGYLCSEIAALAILTRGHADRVICVSGCRYDHAANNRDESYADFIERIATSGNAMAIAVKIADLDDNLDPRRSQGESLAKRYRAARLRLTMTEE